MKILIELPEAEYDLIMKSDKTVFADASGKEAMMYAIKNGVQFPKECGRLINADSLLNKFDETYRSKIGLVPDCLAEGFVQCEKLIKNEPTIYEGVKNANRNSLIPTGKPVGLYDNPK